MMASINASEYVNQSQIGSGKIRNKAIDPKLERILAQVAKETGVTFVVSSGGQDAKGEGTRRTGSVRHDHGGAADVMAKMPDGTFIDFSTPNGQKQWSSIVTRAKSLGATGIGAGSGYMGNQTVHIGFGKPAVWSSVKSGQPVEPWLQAAYDKPMPPGSIPSVATFTDTGQAPQPRSLPLVNARDIDAGTQQQFRSAGFNPGSTAATREAAVKAFQSTHGLNPDGIVGPKTLAALQRATTTSGSAPSPAPSRGVVVAPHSAVDPVGAGPGSYPTFTGLLNDMTGEPAQRPQPSNGFRFTPANDTGRWGWQSPFMGMGLDSGPGIDMGGIINTANAFTGKPPVDVAVRGGQQQGVATSRDTGLHPGTTTVDTSNKFRSTNSGQTINQGQTVGLSGGRTGVVQADGSIIDNNGRRSRGSSGGKGTAPEGMSTDEVGAFRYHG